MGGFKSFPIQADEHFLTACRYVERNPLRAGLAARADAWRWGSLWHRVHAPCGALLDPWPLPVPPDWAAHVQQAQCDAEVEALRRCVVRGGPFGAGAWVAETAEQLGLQASLRPRGRPRKAPPATPSLCPE